MLKNSVIAFGNCGEKAFWQVTEKGSLIIKGSGETFDYSNESISPWNEAKKSIKRIIIEEGITRIGNHLFDNMTKVKTIELPSTLSQIGEAAFLHTGIKKCVYNGTKEPWKLIVIEKDNEVIKKCIKKYNKK